MPSTRGPPASPTSGASRPMPARRAACSPRPWRPRCSGRSSSRCRRRPRRRGTGGRPWLRVWSSIRSIRRSAIAPISATAMARKSAANPSGAPWKLPHDSTRPSGSTIGLSIADASSFSATKRQCARVSRTAPWTDGVQRIEYGVLHPSGRRVSRGWPRSASRRASCAGWRRTPPGPAAGAGLAGRRRTGRRWPAALDRHRRDHVGLLRGAVGCRRWRGTACPRMRVGAVGDGETLLLGEFDRFESGVAQRFGGRSDFSPRCTTSPSPSRASAPWASGARSPLAPSEPYSGTIGEMPALRRSTIACATSGRAPL